MSSDYQQHFDDDGPQEHGANEGQAEVHVMSAMQRIEARREQMELEKMLNADFDFD